MTIPDFALQYLSILQMRALSAQIEALHYTLLLTLKKQPGSDGIDSISAKCSVPDWHMPLLDQNDAIKAEIARRLERDDDPDAR